MRLTLEPKKAIGPVSLGATRTEVRSEMVALGVPLDSEKECMDYFFDHAIQVEYESDDTACFIGIASHPEISLMYYEIDLFDTDAEDAFDLIGQHEESKNHDFTESEFVFPDQIITLWEADSQYDSKGVEGRKIWGQIGIGDERYLSAIG